MIIDPYTWHELQIQHLAHLTSDTISVRVPKPARYNYRSGQYAIIRVRVEGAPLLRQYSFASSPANDFLEFLIQREPSGIVTNWFHDDATVGTSIEISQPFGSFGDMTNERPLLLIAGRVGIAPFVSIIRNELAAGHDTDISLLYSARSEELFCYPELLDSVSTTYFNTGTSIRIDTAALKDHLTPATRVYLCGSKQFVDSLTNQLLDLGVPPTHLRRELFTLQ